MHVLGKNGAIMTESVSVYGATIAVPVEGRPTPNKYVPHQGPKEIARRKARQHG